MITDRRVFEDEFVPSTLEHRDGETDVLVQAFKPAVRGEPPADVLIHGPSGVGKTVLARYTLRKLEAEADVDHAFVRCLGKSTGGVLRSILEALGGDPSPTTPIDDLRGALTERIDDPLVVVLDEADGLPDTEVLEYLTDTRGIGVVPICHDAEAWLARTSDDVRQTFTGSGSEELELTRYRLEELVDILQERTHQGLRPGVVEQQHLEGIANEVAGVARFGIQSLRAAAEIADERDHQQIRKPDVRDSFERARRRIRAANLDSLPVHHHVIYEIVRLGGPIDGPTLHERYDEVAADVYHGRDVAPIGKRARRKKLQKLREYELIECDGDTRDRHYWACDETLVGRVEIGDLPPSA